jgi:hypothetical protein
MPLALGRSGTRQMRSRELCNSPNTVVAPIQGDDAAGRGGDALSRPARQSGSGLPAPCLAVRPSIARRSHLAASRPSKLAP